MPKEPRVVPADGSAPHVGLLHHPVTRQIASGSASPDAHAAVVKELADLDGR